MFQDVQFRQRFATGLAATRRHHGEHVPTGDSREVGEAREPLERAGEQLVIRTVTHYFRSRSVGPDL
ncbi:hypothetical protein D3C81_2042230 [compost metagenome]